MPISLPRVLDVLMAFIVIMFVPIGIWRGALREWMALGGIVLAGALADEWATGGGDQFAMWASLDQRVARFTVGSLLFVGLILLLGYGSGITLPYRPDLTWPNRLTGAAISLGNGTLILSGVLRIMQRYLFDDAPSSPLLTSYFAAYLIKSIGWTYLALACLLALAVGAGLRRRWNGEPALLDEFVPGDLDTSHAGWNERAPSEPVYGSQAPYHDEEEDSSWREARPVIGAAFAAQETDVLRLFESGSPRTDETSRSNEEPATGWASGGVASPIEQPEPHVVTIVRPVKRTPEHPFPGPDGQDDPTAPVNVVARAGDASTVVDRNTGTSREIASSVVNGKQTLGGPGATTCAVCGNGLGVAARFCASCGHIRGETERRMVRLKPTD